MHRKGFTLVELSIVLVILGLLVGGVLTGQSLIRAAELRSITTQEQRYIAAVQTFRDKYFALPGDMTNAQSYWGVATNCPGTSSQPSTTAATCNGDGNGQINSGAATSDEVFRFWQHLANAGLIEGNYSGVQGVGAISALTSNAPSGRISGSLWFAFYFGTNVGGGYGIFDGQYDNSLEIGINSGSGNNWPYNVMLKPEEAFNIDVKLDDGKPATGRVVAMTGVAGFAACTDTSSSATLTANYLLSSSALGCGLVFRQAF